MFQLGGLLAGQHDIEKERQPPSRPTPVTFPSLDPPVPSVPNPPASWTNDSVPGIAAHFLSLKKPSDVNSHTLALLNVSFQPQCDFETLLAAVSSDAQVHLPPSSWLKAPEQDPPKPSEPTAKLLSNGRRAPDRNDFYSRAKELCFKNEDAFANLSRKPKGEKVPLRLAHFRKFWEGLDNMAYYWDNSLDEYLPPNHEQGNDDSIISVSSREAGEADSNTVHSPLSPNSEEPRKKAKTELMTKHVDFSKGSYKGYRTGNGAEMPDSYRLDCVRAFLEPIAWAFGVTLMPHRRPPVLLLEHVRFPVRVSTVAWRGPKDRMKARSGWMEGPVLGVQCRADTGFGSAGDLQADSVLDAVRELGGMLLLAQERAREGRIERRSGEGKWWTTTHRWGGGPGGEVGEGTGASDTPPEEHTPKADEKLNSRARVGSKDRRKPTPAEIWKAIKPGNPLWDPKITYEAIGKDRSIGWDDIFMVSSLNHHISVLRLRVHPLYVQYLTEGTLPRDTPSDPDWCSPKLQRTGWYDLFNINERTEAMRGVWGIMDYLMRAQETPDVPMKDA